MGPSQAAEKGDAIPLDVGAKGMTCLGGSSRYVVAGTAGASQRWRQVRAQLPERTVLDRVPGDDGAGMRGYFYLRAVDVIASELIDRDFALGRVEA